MHADRDERIGPDRPKNAHKREISDISNHPEFFQDSLVPSEHEGKRYGEANIAIIKSRESIDYDEREFVLST